MSDNTHTDGSGEPLSEDDIREMAREETAATASDGTTVSVADLVAQGFSREEALGVVGLVALGASFLGAVATVTSENARAQVATTGSGTFSIDTIISNTLETGTVETDQLTGDVVGRTASIDHLAGNLTVSSTQPSSPDDDDVLFLLGGSP